MIRHRIEDTEKFVSKSTISNFIFFKTLFNIFHLMLKKIISMDSCECSEKSVQPFKILFGEFTIESLHWDSILSFPRQIKYFQ